MRVTDSFRYEIYKNSLNVMKSQLDKLGQEVSSGKKILDPSDDPVGSAEAVRLQTQQDQNSQYVKNLTQLTTLGSMYETSANSVSDILSNAKQLATTMASSTQDRSTRAIAAQEVQGMIDQLVTVGNTKVGGTYIFGGKKSNTPAFTLNADYSVTFNGTSDVPKIEVSKGNTQNLGFSGQTFFGYQGGSDVFAALKGLKTALENNDQTGITNSIDSISSGVDLVANDLASVGNYNKMATNLTDTLNSNNIALKTTMSGITDVDTAQAYSDYTTLSTAYEASLSILSKMQAMNVLNYLK